MESQGFLPIGENRKKGLRKPRRRESGLKPPLQNQRRGSPLTPSQSNRHDNHHRTKRPDHRCLPRITRERRRHLGGQSTVSAFFKRSRKDEARLAEIWDEQEQQRHDKLYSDPVLDRIPARKPKGKVSQLLKTLDSLEQGGTR